LELAKGIIETIDAFSALNNTDREISLVIAGDGPDADIVKKHVKKIGNDRIELVGYISGKKKRNILECSHLMCFPTSYGEGLPVVILEAMAFGIPIITRPVGGIPDIFADGVNGFYVQSLDREAYSKLLKEVIADKESLVRISLNNYKLARERFLSSLVAKKLDEIYRRMIAL
jgi:glycosyltransferase involved in cell wall biosynthesis